MPVGQFSATRSNYYSVGDGKIRSTSKNGEGEKVIAYHDYLEGYLLSVTLKTDTYQGEEMHKILFKLSDADGAEYDVLQVGEQSNFARDIINRLASAMPENGMFREWIRITPYLSEDETNKKSYTRGSLRVGGEKVKPCYAHDQIPAVDAVKIGMKTVKDDSARIEFFRKIIGHISLHLPGDSTASAKQVASVEIEPEEVSLAPF